VRPLRGVRPVKDRSWLKPNRINGSIPLRSTKSASSILARLSRLGRTGDGFDSH